MSKKIIILLTIAMTLTLSGCGFKDIDKRFFVVTIGVDKGENGHAYKVSLLLALPSAKPQEPGGRLVLAEEADSISAAVSLIKAKADKEIDFGHAKIIIFGKKIADKNLYTAMDWFARRRDIQEIAYIAIGTPSARTILNYQPEGELIPSNTLFLLFGKEGTESPYITSTQLFDTWRNLNEPGENALLPIIKFIKDENTLQVQNAGIVKDNRSLLVLPKNDTMLLNMLMRGARTTTLNVKMQNGNFSITTNKVKSHYKIKNENGTGKVSIQFRVEIEGNLEEIHEKNKTKKDLNNLQKLVDHTFQKQFYSLLKKLQKENADPIGFGLRYRASHFGDEMEKFRTWKRLYPDAKIEVNVHTKLIGSGVIK